MVKTSLVQVARSVFAVGTWTVVLLSVVVVLCSVLGVGLELRLRF